MTPLNALDLSLFVEATPRSPEDLSNQELAKEIVTAATLVSSTWNGPFSPEKVSTFLQENPVFHLQTGYGVTALVEEAMKENRLNNPTGILLNYIVAKHFLLHRETELIRSMKPGAMELEMAADISREFDQAFAFEVPSAIKCFGADLFAQWPGGRPNDAVSRSQLVADRGPR